MVEGDYKRVWTTDSVEPMSLPYVVLAVDNIPLQCEGVENLDTEGSALMQRLGSLMAKKVSSTVVSEWCGNVVDVCDGSGYEYDKGGNGEEEVDDGVPEEDELFEEEEEDSEEDLSDEELGGDDEFGVGEDGSEWGDEESEEEEEELGEGV